ncbi:hypothetical protein DIC66_08235 [Rhodoferax lacus]|uniref:Uncharacterized protein n=1 Tax=Rhodoferax lacus TaxID=2184758 RepID=A0A3E1RCN3_9BURK|nr:hypothetical protein [Rhodoferax lacus]RFO97125.1 hypothetical protein DIC66_08235 [Rhodoferax lacus]
MHNEPMRVILGASSLKAYVTAPKTMHVLGIVRFGQEYGLLATNSEGTFFRVNGSSMVALDAYRVHRAIEIAHRNGERAGLGPVHHAREDFAPSGAAPLVSVRKHRHAEMHANA